MAYSRIVESAEKAKCELSTSPQTNVNIPYITVVDGAPQHLDTTITRAKFEALTSSLTDRVIDCGVKCLEKAGKTASELTSVLLVGGSTRMLAIQDALEKKFGCPLDKSANPDEAVAIGAAIQANILSGDASSDLLLLDVTPISLGIETMGGVMTKLIDANSSIPIEKKQTFSTAADNQPGVEIHVLQGERPMAADNRSVARFNLDGIAPAPRGVPQIEVSFTIDANGILSVSAKDLGTGKEQHITVDNQNSLTQEEIDKIKADAERYKAEDEKKEQEIKEFNSLEQYVYAVEASVEAKEGAIPLNDEQKEQLTEILKRAKDVMSERKVDTLKPIVEEIKAIYDPIVQDLYSKAQAEQTTQQNPFDNVSESENPFTV